MIFFKTCIIKYKKEKGRFIYLYKKEELEVKISELEEKYGFVNFEGKDYILKELMKLTTEGGISANALDCRGNQFIVYFRKLDDYDKVIKIESVK